jgi:AcrR family transcriptional regulator
VARPKNADPEKTRERILSAAIRRFGERGLDGTTLRQIAADAGVTFATVHHYFGSKAALFDRCLAEGYAQLGDLEAALAANLGSTSPTEGRIRALATDAFRFALGQRDTTRFLLRATLYERQTQSRGRIEDAQRSYLDVASHAVSLMVGRPPEELRVPLQGLMFLLTRLAVTDERELEVIAGESNRAREALERYVGDVAVATLLPPGDER